MDSKLNKFLKTIKKIAVAMLIGFSFFFAGLFCAAISPLIALLSLIYTPTTTITQKFKSSWDDTFKDLKELQDPDYKEKWKKDHDNLYNQNDNDEKND